jgi:ParB-like chromosome segregation protein Spo0J
MIVKISDIRIGKRKRAHDITKARELAESIKVLGLLNAVTLNSNNELISGLHRLEAYKLVGFEAIEATKKDFGTIQRELADILASFIIILKDNKIKIITLFCPQKIRSSRDFPLQR